MFRKPWHEYFLEIQNEEQFLPWEMTCEHCGICMLGDPSAQANRIVEGTTHDLLGGDGPDACASRNGWVAAHDIIYGSSSEIDARQSSGMAFCFRHHSSPGT
ncbi:hypothetical protein Ddye_028339 [Dipteronia dyeriana]|uniref:Uncharacterized protein n=1 Tax=Dipteronia dyeriana TaxID=168575 RepID=A0AAD9WR28_9ROSI|nr:hypothetical protein Ddye_028339 [Dipteronia dyeriana]